MSDLLLAYQYGIGIGVIVLSTLLLFPGTSEKEDGRNDAANAQRNATATANSGRNHIDDDALSQRKDGNDGSYWTPHRKLNWGVYVILISMVCFIFWCEYGVV